MNKNSKQYCVLLFLMAINTKWGISQSYTKADSLRGSVTAERAWWDLLSYNLKVKVMPVEKALSGSNTIEYKVLLANNTMQIDLQEPMQIDSVLQENQKLVFKKISKNVYHIYTKISKIAATNSLEIYYSGKPTEAKRPPWDGGLQWSKDVEGNYWIATSCQGLGASVWWPCKDHMYDEPDMGMSIQVTVPKGYTDVSNGILQNTTANADGTLSYLWQVKNPINNYGVNLNVGKYQSWQETYKGEKGDLLLSYYYLKNDEEKAKKQWAEVPRMLKAFEYWFGPYPFYDDGYKLVQVPYLGMEHQSSVTYGNKFQNGYLGRDLSGTGVGLLWDFIIVHESGHEWWANNITYKDMADMWIHESFTAYSETLFTEYYFGKEKAKQYVIGTRNAIKNKVPMITDYNVNADHPDTDIYYKGANMIHTLRQIIGNDEQFRMMLRHLQLKFYHKTVSSKDIEQEISSYTKIDFTQFFNQYLRTANIPEFQYRWRRKNLEYRLVNVTKKYWMPLKVTVGGKTQLIKPNTAWLGMKVGKIVPVVLDENYYLSSKLVKVP